MEVSNKLVKALLTNNTADSNILKAVEEMAELSVELTKHVYNSINGKPSIRIIELHSELSHVIIRLEVLKSMFSTELVEKEIDKKTKQILKKFETLKNEQ
jgi:hypothetical protein